MVADPRDWRQCRIGDVLAWCLQALATITVVSMRSLEAQMASLVWGRMILTRVVLGIDRSRVLSWLPASRTPDVCKRTDGWSPAFTAGPAALSTCVSVGPAGLGAH